MDCSDETKFQLDTNAVNLCNKTSVTNKICSDSEVSKEINDVPEKTCSPRKKEKPSCMEPKFNVHKVDEDLKRKCLSLSSGSGFQRSPATPNKKLQKLIEAGPKEKPTTTLTCEICSQQFTETSHLTQHLLGHISSTSSFQPYDFDSGIKKGLESSSIEKSSVKEEDGGVEEDDDDEDKGRGDEKKNISLTERTPIPIQTIPSHPPCPNTKQNNAVSISSPSSLTSPSIVDLSFSGSTTPMVKQKNSPAVTSEYKGNKTEVKKIKVNTSNSKSIQPSKGEKELKCEICQRVFTWSSALTRHLRIHSGEKPFSCEVCHKSFFQSSDLTQHLRVHTGERPFKCSLCTAAFSQLSALSRHLRCHFGEKPYVCTVCQRAFSQSSALSRHMCSHSEEKLFICEICGKSFSWSEPLLRHVRTHTGEKPYKCEICAKSFSQTANLSTHMRVHSGEKPFKCPLCDRAFPVSSNLTRHMKTHKDGVNEQTPVDPLTPTTLQMDPTDPTTLSLDPDDPTTSTFDPVVSTSLNFDHAAPSTPTTLTFDPALDSLTEPAV